MDATFLDAYLSDFLYFVQPSFTKEVRTEIHLAVKVLLAVFERYPAATLRQVFEHTTTPPACAELPAAAHSVVATLRRMNSGHGEYAAVWPVHPSPYQRGTPLASTTTRRHFVPPSSPPPPATRSLWREYITSRDGNGSSRNHRSS